MSWWRAVMVVAFWAAVLLLAAGVVVRWTVALAAAFGPPGVLVAVVATGLLALTGVAAVVFWWRR